MDLYTDEGMCEVNETYYKKLFNFVYYRVLNPTEAEDIVSDAFLKMLAARDSYRPEKAALSTWLFTIARNCIIDRARKKGRLVALDTLAEGAACCESDTEKVDQRLELESLLSHLSDRERELIAMRYDLRLSGAEIASITGLTAGNVSVILSRAVKKLQKISESA